MKYVRFRKYNKEYDFACDSYGYGLFYRDERDWGSFRQLLGSCQTPKFKTPQQFIRWIRRRYHRPGRVVRISSDWE